MKRIPTQKIAKNKTIRMRQPTGIANESKEQRKCELREIKNLLRRTTIFESDNNTNNTPSSTITNEEK